MTSTATGVTPGNQRSTPEYIETLSMPRRVGEVTYCTPEHHDEWWGEYKIHIKPKNSNDVVEAWTTEKPEKGTTVQFCHGCAGIASHVYTWFETKNGNCDLDWRPNLV